MAKKIEASGLDWVVKQYINRGKEPDEFTIKDVCERMRQSGIPFSLDAMRYRMKARVAKGELEARTIYENGRACLAYRKKP